jgi:iron complex outermembrane receptor protein
MSKVVLPRIGRGWVIALAIPVLRATSLEAQGRPADSTSVSRDSAAAQKLERVMISAVRGAGLAPISEKTIARESIEPRYFGQDVPIVLRGAAPSVSAYAETGNYWGYSYIRLRGIDHSRINFTLDGIPLNDPEDQVLYFADFPDLANSLQSAQVQRGVGTSSNGTAAYAGSINLESVALATRRSGAEAQLEGGSFGSARVSAEYQSGLLPNRFAWYGRISGLRTNGYRYHSGVEGRSAFFSGGYFGDRDIIKLTATAGLMRDTMAYLAVPEADLDTNRRINPLTPRERDAFGEQLAALSYTRLLTPASSITTTAYRISASGNYDVLIDSLWNFNLDFVWYGLTSAWSYRTGDLQLDIGANGNTYARDHYVFVRPDLSSSLYFNTGHKQDVSAFAKVAYVFGRATIFGDLQARHAAFRYSPDAHAGIGEQSIDWTFVNPKAGLTYQLAPSSPWSLYASYGKNTREPARSDMFAGFDNLDTSNVEFVGDLARVKPETVHDIEAGVSFRAPSLDLRANLYAMQFRNEIAPIGALSYIGTPLRKNVDASYRRGVEADVTYRGIRDVLLTGNVTLSTNRISDYTTDSGDSPVVYHHVEPLLTPRVMTMQRIEHSPSHSVSLALEHRYQSRAFLQNTSDPRFVLPASSEVDGSVAISLGRHEITLRGNNLTNSKKYGSGYASGGVSYYYILPPRNFFVTAKLVF